jgi:hypothetical protein
MFWEEAIDLIKTHQHPSPVYEYKGGTLKTSYIDIEDFPITLRWRINKYLKYDLTDLQLFCSLGASEGIGGHTDPCNVLIICLEGEMAYSIERMPPVILTAGDTIYIGKGLLHLPISSTVPRICLSAEVRGTVPKEEVTHYFG